MRLSFRSRYAAGAIAATLLLATYITGTPRTAPAAQQGTQRHNWISPAVEKAAATQGLLFVADSANSVVDIFPVHDPTVPIGKIVNLIRQPFALAVDKSRNLYVLNGQCSILKFAPPYTGTPIASYLGGFCGGGGIAIGSDGTIYKASGFNDLTEFGLTSTLGTEINLPVSPTGLVTDASDNLYVTYDSAGASGVFKLPASAKLVAGPVNPKNLGIPLAAGARDIAFDGSGNLVVEDLTTHSITVYKPGGKKPIQTIDPGFQFPLFMTFDGQKKRLFVADLGDNTVKIVAYPSGKLLRTLSGIGQPFGVAVAPATP